MGRSYSPKVETIIMKELLQLLGNGKQLHQATNLHAS